MFYPYHFTWVWQDLVFMLVLEVVVVVLFLVFTKD